MKVRAGIWDYLSRVVLVLLLAAGLAGLFYLYLPLIKMNQNYRQRIVALDREVEKEEHRARQIKDMTEGVQRDPRMLDRAAREILGYARTNELVVRFESSPPTTAGTRPKAR